MNNTRIILARAKNIAYKKILKNWDKLFYTNFYWNYVFHRNGYHKDDYSFSEKQIAFVHLPKTGGTSFYKVLQQDKKQRFVGLKVHRPISLKCPPYTRKYVTIIRNPIDRVWSLYNMEKNPSISTAYEKYAKRGLEQFLSNCWEARNMACRYYSGDVESSLDKYILSQAFKNLKDFYAIINFDNLAVEATTFLEAHKIEVNILPHERKAKYPKPSEAEVALIKKFNRYDIMLMERWKESKMGNL